MECNHKKWFYPEPAFNDWTGELENVPAYEDFTYEDIDTGRFKCTQCNKVMYYTGLWKRFYEEDIPCSGSDKIVKNSMNQEATDSLRAEIDAQAAEIERLTEARNVWRLQIELDTLRKDAARYRWLRIQDNEDFCFAVVKNPHFDIYEASELDDAIDEELLMEALE